MPKVSSVQIRVLEPLEEICVPSSVQDSTAYIFIGGVYACVDDNEANIAGWKPSRSPCEGNLVRDTEW